jgi:hypothetical protein
MTEYIYIRDLLFSHEWNELRPECPDMRGIDLDHCPLGLIDFANVNLCGASMINANLGGSTFCGAKMCKVNLIGANLCGADLRWVNLRGANLTGVNLRGADLYRANLRDTVIRNADLAGVNLRGADFTGAYIKNCIICEATFSGTFGLRRASDWLSQCDRDDYGLIVYFEQPPVESWPSYWGFAAGLDISETPNPDRTMVHGSGITFRRKLVDFPPSVSTMWRCRIRWEDMADVVVPYCGETARCGRLELLEKVPSGVDGRR